jgi:hypothetical protein
LNGITSTLNFTKTYQAVQKLLVGDRQTHRQTGDLISLLSFLESSLKIRIKYLFKILRITLQTFERTASLWTLSLHFFAFSLIWKWIFDIYWQCSYTLCFLSIRVLLEKFTVPHTGAMTRNIFISSLLSVKL